MGGRGGARGPAGHQTPVKWRGDTALMNHPAGHFPPSHGHFTPPEAVLTYHARMPNPGSERIARPQTAAPTPTEVSE